MVTTNAAVTAAVLALTLGAGGIAVVNNAPTLDESSNLGQLYANETDAPSAAAAADAAGNNSGDINADDGRHIVVVVRDRNSGQVIDQRTFINVNDNRTEVNSWIEQHGDGVVVSTQAVRANNTDTRVGTNVANAPNASAGTTNVERVGEVAIGGMAGGDTSMVEDSPTVNNSGTGSVAVSDVGNPTAKSRTETSANVNASAS